MTFPIPTGTKIYDERGEVFATVKRDLHRGDHVRKDDFEFTNGHKPVRGEQIAAPISNFLCGNSQVAA